MTDTAYRPLSDAERDAMAFTVKACVKASLEERAAIVAYVRGFGFNHLADLIFKGRHHDEKR